MIMTMLRALLAIALVAPAPAAYAHETPAPFTVTDTQGVFLAMTDIHFDPYAQPDLVPKLDQNPVENWTSIFQAGGGTEFQGYGNDAGFPLATSAMATAAQLFPSYDYVIYTGDYLSHGFGSDYSRYAGSSPNGLTSFAIKTSEYVGRMMQQSFGRVPIIGVMGNNDAVCGDYMIAPNSPLTEGIRQQWGTLSQQPDRFAEFPLGGYYKIAHPTVPDQDMIVLNNIFWTTRYQDSCNPTGGDPGAAMMSWLDYQLYATQQAGRKAQILMHVPPGINAYSTSNNTGTCSNRISPFWESTYGEGYLALMRKYKGVVDHSFSGHTHMDGFNVISDSDDTPIVAHHVTPSVSPIFGNNPSFTAYLYDRDTGNILNSATFYLANLAATGSGAAANWQLEYVFADTYDQADMSAKSMATAAAQMNSDSAMRDWFMQFYPVSSTNSNPVTKTNFKAFSCAMTAIGEKEYESCYCGL